MPYVTDKRIVYPVGKDHVIHDILERNNSEDFPILKKPKYSFKKKCISNILSFFTCYCYKKDRSQVYVVSS
jgi:hypothetical protein